MPRESTYQLERGPGMQHLVDLGNGVRLDSYWPKSNAEPFFYLSQSGYQAPLKPAQIRPLIEALEQLEESLWANLGPAGQKQGDSDG